MKKGLRLGVDLGGTAVKLALVNEHAHIVEMKEIQTSQEPKALVHTLRKAVDPWLHFKILGTGVGVAGDVDPKRGVVRFAPNLQWKNVPLRRYFQQAGFPNPLHLENDATAAAWGAYHAELKGRSQNLIVLTLGTGVGGGLVLDHRLYRGASGTAGEIGHMSVDPNGPLCGCGSHGCLETYMGGIYLVKWARQEMIRRGRRPPSSLTPKDLFKAARQGDPVARATWQRAGHALGLGLSSLLNIFNPDTLLLCGGVAAAAPQFLPIARREIRQRAFKTVRQAVKIRVSHQGARLGVIGAALLVS